MTHSSNERGVVSVMVVISLPVVFAVLGLAFDIGHLYALQSEAQMAADAAAIAAARELKNGNEDQLVAMALEDAALNDFGPGSNTQVDINRPPTLGPKTGNADFVEVIIRQDAPAYFWRLVSSEQITVEARAVAGVLAGGGNCILALDPSMSQSVTVQGKADVTLQNCGAHVNSSSSSAGHLGSSANFTAASIDVVGDVIGNHWTPLPQTGAPVVADPYASLAEPSYSGCDHDGEYVVDGTATLNPGVYCGGIKVTGNATFNPGTYILAGGGMIFTGDADVRGDEVTFFNSSSNDYDYKKIAITLTSSGSLRLTAPTSGPLKGILFFQDRTDFNSGEPLEFKNDTAIELTGVIYMPNTPVLITDKTILNEQSVIIVARSIRFDDDVQVSFRLDPNTSSLPSTAQEAKLIE